MCVGHHFVHDIDALFVSDLLEGVVDERNVVGFTKVYVIIGYVVN